MSLSTWAIYIFQYTFSSFKLINPINRKYVLHMVVNDLQRRNKNLGRSLSLSSFSDNKIAFGMSMKFANWKSVCHISIIDQKWNHGEMQLNKQHFLDLGANPDNTAAETDLHRLCIHIFFSRHLQSATECHSWILPLSKAKSWVSAVVANQLWDAIVGLCKEICKQLARQVSHC